MSTLISTMFISSTSTQLCEHRSLGAHVAGEPHISFGCKRNQINRGLCSSMEPKVVFTCNGYSRLLWLHVLQSICEAKEQPWDSENRYRTILANSFLLAFFATFTTLSDFITGGSDFN
ncbi:unnamed protein product [Cuscuta epithymum]|uniref:PGG domain-containing protein n=1 Tax=Cuscuta epithymum TaxID=186058 RepID=A0AAV0FA89_9ASTE|nr:unnamed protein product [Cuscuta epithymum]